MNGIRLSKLVIVLLVTFYFCLVVFNNVTDYSSNFMFVSNVTSMTDIFPDSQQRWRAIESPALHHIFYVMIICTEFAVAILMALGLKEMWKNRSADQIVFQKAKRMAIYGLTLAVTIWFGVFICIAGEWFLMWQSQKWDGNPTAFRNAILILVCLVYIVRKD